MLDRSSSRDAHLAHVEHQILTRAGRSRLLHWDRTYFHDERGQVAGIAAVGGDTTERKCLEALLLQAHKMESIGRLAGGVAHDFNNLLTAIGDHANFAMEDIPPGNPACEQIEQVLKAADRASSLTQQLLAFSRRQVMQVKLLNLAVNARDAMLPASNGNGRRLTITTANAVLAVPSRGQRFVIKPGAYVVLSVSDNRVGMSAAAIYTCSSPS